MSNFIVINVWDSYETTERVFDDYEDAVEYFNDWKDYGESCYLTLVIKTREAIE